MTTIAYREGILAGDGRVSDADGHIWRDNDRKVFKLPDGSLFAGAGAEEGLEILKAHMQKGHYRVMPDLHGADITGLHIRTNGRLYVTEGGIWYEWPDDFIAIGSGKRCALTALRLGFTAVRAVKEGIAGDVNSGGKITVVKLMKKGK